MFLKRKWYYAATTSVIVTLYGGEYYMYKQECQTVITVLTADANGPNWPNKKIRFDTSEWLQQLQYIKIDDHYILNTQYTPIANLDNFGITLKLQSALDGSDRRLLAPYGLAEMSAQRFEDLVRGKIRCEYLRTTFDTGTLKPVDDYFLISFTYKDKWYESETGKKISKTGDDGYFLRAFDNTVYKAGYQHSTDPVAYSYRDYQNGKAVK